MVQTLLQPHPDLALVGDLNLPIAKLRAGNLLASMLEPRRRLDQPLHAAILAGALGSPSGVSKSQLSPIRQLIGQQVKPA